MYFLSFVTNQCRVLGVEMNYEAIHKGRQLSNKRPLLYIVL